jgi:hypothetical protein
MGSTDSQRLPFTQQLLRGKLISTKIIFVCSVCQFETGNEIVLHTHMREDHLNSVFVNWENPSAEEDLPESSVKESKANVSLKLGNYQFELVRNVDQ